jgi:hypothetical protein
MRIFIIIAVLVIAGCSNTPGLSVYSFTNSDVESVLNQQLPKLSKKIRLISLPVQFTVNNLSADIGPDNRDVVALSVDSTAEINVFTLRYPVSLKLQLEGAPFYDSEKKAVFMRNIKLLDSSIDAADFKGNLGLLDDKAMTIINAFLASTPVYKLNMNDPKIALLSKLPLDIKVVEGAITLIPRL